MKKIVPVLMALLVVSCQKKDVPQVDFAAEMRSFIIEISASAKAIEPDFLIVPQNGIRILTDDHQIDGLIDPAYVNAIDGQGQEDLFFGFDQDDKATNQVDFNALSAFCDLMEDKGKSVLVTDYCSSEPNIDKSYSNNESKSYASFAAADRDLDEIPSYPAVPFNANSNDIDSLSEVKNFLYLINPDKKYADKDIFVDAMAETNYDLLIVDLFFNTEQLEAKDVQELRIKNNGGERLVLCYMSIGEAEDYRYYWKKDWDRRSRQPDWLYKENKNWRGNYKVFYWKDEWKDIIFGNSDAYLTKIQEAGFDGTYLDIVDAYDYYLEN
jgi:cysteinyl-tRNA synthetase, unknown class